MNKIIFFDIDGTLFDAESFIQGFYKNLSHKFKLNDQDFDEINKIYRDIKAEYGYFVPNIYLERINDAFPSVDKANLKKVFWDDIEKYLFEDSKVLTELTDKAKIAFFSKGDEVFQKAKIERFIPISQAADTYIFSEKVDKFSEFLPQYSKLRCIFVDDDLTVLRAAKEYDMNLKTILIDRKGKVGQNENIDFVIKTISDIIPILNE